jgi:hypothetical protein
MLGYNNGKTQEEYGPPVAEGLLRDMGFPPDKIVKVCEIISNHHSRSRYDYVELRILKEADRIVNRMTRNRSEPSRGQTRKKRGETQESKTLRQSPSKMYHQDICPKNNGYAKTCRARAAHVGPKAQ